MSDLLNAAYDYIRHEGSLLGGVIAGMLTLVGGLLAYLAGVAQARATKEAAGQQVAAIRAQTEQERRLIADRDRRNANALALSAEASRVKMIATEGLQLVQQLVTRHSGSEIMSPENTRAFFIECDAGVRSRLASDTLLDREVVVAGMLLFARLDQLNTKVRLNGPLAEVCAPALTELLQRVGRAAQELQGTVAGAIGG